ncbi:MAG: hypothetical protein AB1489_24170 [Acidobacteriota bacterium]
MKDIFILPTGQIRPNAINLEMGRLDPENLCFDRVPELSKYAFRSAAKQLAEAVILGLHMPNQFVTSHIEHACNVFACAIFLEPSIVKNPQFNRLLDAVDRLDTFGPAYPVSEVTANQIRTLMSPIWKLRNEGRLYALLPNEVARLLRTTAQQVIDYCNGVLRLVIEKESPRTYEVHFERGAVIIVESQHFVFDLLYNKGYKVCIVFRRLENGYKFDIAKQSEFVRFELNLLVAELNRLEQGWVCTSTTAHSPRTASSTIEPSQLWQQILPLINSKLVKLT